MGYPKSAWTFPLVAVLVAPAHPVETLPWREQEPAPRLSQARKSQRKSPKPPLAPENVPKPPLVDRSSETPPADPWESPNHESFYSLWEVYDNGDNRHRWLFDPAESTSPDPGVAVHTDAELSASPAYRAPAADRPGAVIRYRGSPDAASLDLGARVQTSDGFVCEYGERFVANFDKSCLRDDDCIRVTAVWDCCGTSLAAGINFTQSDRFEKKKLVCREALQWCDCLPGNTLAEDLGVAAQPRSIRLECIQGTCMTLTSR